MAFDAQQKRLLFGVAALIGGIAAILQGWSLLCDWREARRVAKPKMLGTGGLGESLADANTRTKGVITNVTRYNVKNIKERVSLIAGLARKDFLKPAIRESALAVLTRKTGSGENRKWAVPPKDWKAEVQALYLATTDPRSDLAVRYTLDPARVDMYTSPEKTQILKGEDCDGLTALLTARLMAVGYSPQLVTMGTAKSPGGDFSHILLRVPKPSLATDGSQLGGAEDFIILDPSMPEKGFGWEPPGMTEAIRLNRPAGVVTKLKIYKI